MSFVEAIPQVYIHRLYQSKHLCHVGIVIISCLSQCLERRITGPWMCIGKVRSNKIQTPRLNVPQKKVSSTQRPKRLLVGIEIHDSKGINIANATKTMNVLLFRFQVRCGKWLRRQWPWQQYAKGCCHIRLLCLISQCPNVSPWNPRNWSIHASSSTYSTTFQDCRSLGWVWRVWMGKDCVGKCASFGLCPYLLTQSASIRLLSGHPVAFKPTGSTRLWKQKMQSS